MNCEVSRIFNQGVIGLMRFPPIELFHLSYFKLQKINYPDSYQLVISNIENPIGICPLQISIFYRQQLKIQ